MTARGGAGPSAQEGFTCAALVNRTGRCWGRNDFGQLGDGTTTDPLAPVSPRW